MLVYTYIMNIYNYNLFNKLYIIIYKNLLIKTNRKLKYNFIRQFYKILIHELEIFSQVVGLSCVDVVSTLISVIEFQDNESFSNLESLIVTLAPKECLLIQGEGSYEFQTLKQVHI